MSTDDADVEGKKVELPADGGGAVAVDLSPEVAERVDASRLESRYGSGVNVHANTNAGQSDVIPVSSVADANLGSSIGDNLKYQRIDNDQIQKLRDKRIEYDDVVAEWLLKNDDLVPSIRERFAGLILGENGLTVEPMDADAEADKRLAEHMEEVYREEVKPHRVVRRSLTDNFAHALHVARSTDLAALELEHLDLYTDAATGERVFVQDGMSYPVVELGADYDGDGNVDDPDKVDIHTEESEEQALIEGEDVFTVELFENPPLEAVATDIVHKLQLKIFKARKAEVASVGGVYIRVKVPEWLEEDQYDARPDGWTEENDVPDTRLEQEVQVGLDDAMDTLQSYQSATVMSIPPNWEVDTIELPEQGEPFDDLIRGYNKDIARRFLFSLDLIELQQGSELSRDTLFKTLLNTVAGWRRQFIDLFDDFADMVADIHDVPGSVEHSFSSLEEGNAESLIQLLQSAGVLGLSQEEARTIANQITGVNLDATKDAMESDQEMAPGGPGSPGDREESMESFLEDTDAPAGPDDRDGGVDDTPPASAADALAVLPVSAASEEAVHEEYGEEEIELPTVCRMCEERTRMQGNFRCPECHPDTSPEEYDGPMATDAEAADAGDGEEASAAAMEHMTTGTVGGTFDPEELDAAVEALEEIPGVTAVRTAENHDPGLHILVDHAETDDRVNYPARIEEALEGSPFSTPDVPDVLASAPDDGDVHADVGFDPGEPDGWTRLSVIDAWISVGGTWRSCVADMTGEVRSAERWCSALKDEFLGTTMWRKGNGAMAATVMGADADMHADAPTFTLQYDGGLGEFADALEDLLTENADADVSRVQEEDDYVLFQVGEGEVGGDPEDDDKERPDATITVTDTGDGEFTVAGVGKSNSLMYGLEGLEDVEAARPAPVLAAYTFTDAETLREAARDVRELVEKRTPTEHTTEVRPKGDAEFSVIVRNREGNFEASLLVRESVSGDGWTVVGNDDFFQTLRISATGE